MTLQELYDRRGGSYEAARRILPMDTLISKFIIRLLSDESCGRLMEAYARNDARGIFEAAHSMKGVYANLGLLELSSMSSAIAEEVRPGKERKMTDGELSGHIAALDEKYRAAVAAIRQFEAEQD